MKRCTKLEVVQKGCPVVFQGHVSNLNVTRDKKLPILSRTERLQTVTPVWIHQWLWNDAQSLEEQRRGAISIVFQGHVSDYKVTWPCPPPPPPPKKKKKKKITNFDHPNLAFPDCNFSLNSPMAPKWCTKLEVALKFIHKSCLFLTVQLTKSQHCFRLRVGVELVRSHYLNQW